MRLSSRSFTTIGVVLKRHNVGETDRVVSLLTQERGKLIVVAKGVRRLASATRASLEPGNLIQGYCITTRTLPLLTQTKLLEDCAPLRHQLSEIRKLTQFLEIIDRLFVEEELEPSLFSDILSLRRGIVNQALTNGQIKKQLAAIIKHLGYQAPQDTRYASILDYVSVLADKPMRSFEYLAVKA